MRKLKCDFRLQSILRHCGEIYLLESGKIFGKYKYEDLKNEEKYLMCKADAVR